MDGDNMSGQYRISVALCTFNGDRFIGQQLESILNQSRLPDELIICDDASTDDTIEIVNSIAAGRLSTTHIIRNEKRLGCVKNFEKAIKYTTGDIIFLSDQDDVWFKEKILLMMAPFAESDEVGLVYSDAILTNTALKPTGQTLFGRRREMKLLEKRLPHQVVRGVGINGCTMAFRSCLKEFFLPVSEAEGWGHDHWIAFIAHAVMDSRPINKPLMFYRRHTYNSGNDSFLDGGWVNKWVTGLNAAETTDYAKDRYRWEVMLQRLIEVAEKPSLFLEKHTRLSKYIAECEQRLEFARLREHAKQVNRIKRIYPLLQCLIKGNYHRYLRGVKSFLKDVVIR